MPGFGRGARSLRVGRKEAVPLTGDSRSSPWLCRFQRAGPDVFRPPVTSRNGGGGLVISLIPAAAALGAPENDLVSKDSLEEVQHVFDDDLLPPRGSQLLVVAAEVRMREATRLDNGFIVVIADEELAEFRKLRLNVNLRVLAVHLPKCPSRKSPRQRLQEQVADPRWRRNGKLEMGLGRSAYLTFALDLPGTLPGGRSGQVGRACGVGALHERPN